MRKTILALGMVMGVAFTFPAQAIQCVPYAREISGIDLSGNAWRWWSAAAGRYERGKSPQVGSILVFQKTKRMPYGHLAVVRRVINKREIRVDHANWPTSDSRRGDISVDVSVIDVSPNNDWSKVRVWYDPGQVYGARVNPTYGFIYSRPGRHRPEIREAANRMGGEVVTGGVVRPVVALSALSSTPAPESASHHASDTVAELSSSSTVAALSAPVLTPPPSKPVAPGKPTAVSAASLNAQVLAHLRANSARSIKVSSNTTRN